MTYKKINLDENIITKNKIPLLIEDKNWLKLFSNVESKDIQKLKEELIQLIKEEKQLEKQSRTLQKEKKHAMKMILGISDAVNNNNKIETLGLLDEYKKKIEDINEKLDSINFQLETMPQTIRELNFNLLEATVHFGYRELKDKEKKLESVTDELEKLRERLQILINEKYNHICICK